MLAGIAGFLKATVGAHEVITTIYSTGSSSGSARSCSGSRPLQNDTQASIPFSNDILEQAHPPILWGDPLHQGLHVGFLVAIAALVAYWVILNRTTLGYGVKAVGFNPEAARYGEHN